MFQLKNIPFNAYGYAFDDIVLCIKGSDGIPTVTRIIEDSGNGTIRILFSNSLSEAAENILNELNSVNCHYEKASASLVAVSIPHDVELPFSQISNFLNAIDDKILQGWEIGKRIKRRTRGRQ